MSAFFTSTFPSSTSTSPTTTSSSTIIPLENTSIPSIDLQSSISNAEASIQPTAGKTTTPASSDSFSTTGVVVSGPTSDPLTPSPNVNTDQSSSSSISTGSIVGIVFGVVVVLIICLGILLLLRRWLSRRPSVVKSRYNRKEAIEAPELRVVPGNGDTAVPLLLPPASCQHSWTDSVRKRILTDSNVGSESLQTSSQPVSSVMQEVDSLRAQIAEIERRQQQESTRNLTPTGMNANGTEDTQSAPPAYSDDGRS